MGVCRRSERYIAYWGVVKVPDGVSQFARVLNAEFHDEVVRVLTIDNRLAMGGFAGLEEQWIPLIRDGEWFQAQHGAQHDGTAAQRMQGAQHSPIGGP